MAARAEKASKAGTEIMAVIHQLAALARRLNRDAGAPPLPALFFFTDPARTPDPAAAAKRLPRGAGVIYRHFGAPDRRRIARRLAGICRSRGLFLLIAADPDLAREVGAAGVHWPEAKLARARSDLGAGWITAAAHSRQAIEAAARRGAHACFLSPVFPSRSKSAGQALGVFHASQLARGARIPVMALGGVNTTTARDLLGRGFAGIAAIDALS